MQKLSERATLQSELITDLFEERISLTRIWLFEHLILKREVHVVKVTRPIANVDLCRGVKCLLAI